MPTVLTRKGWRLFFYANEGNEPVHIHCRKAGIECKYWLNTAIYDIEEAYSYGLSRQDKRQIRQIIFRNFDLILEQWSEFQRRRHNG